MKKKRKKKKISKVRIIFFGILIYIAVIMINQNKMMKELEGKKALLTNDIHILESEIEELNDELENSDSLEFVEKVAREELGMVKPREIIVIDQDKTKNSFFNIFKKDSN
ncbi:MAG: septum formation initiator family protein [Tissierellaceae bacterium]|nr:septum formation initiator family protein [Tissierellaceae bacterium]